MNNILPGMRYRVADFCNSRERTTMAELVAEFPDFTEENMYYLIGVLINDGTLQGITRTTEKSRGRVMYEVEVFGIIDSI